jgi:hypothetical protein
MRKHRRVTGLPGPDQSYQWSTLAVDEVMDFRAPSTTGTPDRVIKRLVEQIRVIRPNPL